MEILSDVKFWALIISIISLGFSTYPTIRNWRKGEKITIETHNMIGISHSFGRSNFSWPITIINSGGTSLRVKSITLTVKKDGKEKTFPAHTFLREPDSKNPFIYSSILLKPGEEATHTFCFYKRLSQSENKLVSDNYNAAITDLSEPAEGSGGLPMDFSFIPKPSLKPTTLSRVLAIYEANFELTHDEYEVCLRVSNDKGKVMASKDFRFTLYESDEANLRKITEYYSSGDGVTYYSDKQVWFWIGLSEVK